MTKFLEFLGDAWVLEATQAATVELDRLLHELETGPNGKGSGTAVNVQYDRVIKLCVRLAHLHWGAGNVELVRKYYHKAGSLFLTLAGNGGVGPKTLRTTISTGLYSAILAGDWNLAGQISRAYSLRSAGEVKNSQEILACLLRGERSEAELHATGFNLNARLVDADWPGARHQFAFGILRSDAALMKQGIQNATEAFARRWEAKRYTTPAMLAKLGTKDEALVAARNFLVDMGWILYDYGAAYAAYAIRNGMRELLQPDTKWSEWLPLELAYNEAATTT